MSAQESNFNSASRIYEILDQARRHAKKRNCPRSLV